MRKINTSQQNYLVDSDIEPTGQYREMIPFDFITKKHKPISYE